MSRIHPTSHSNRILGFAAGIFCFLLAATFVPRAHGATLSAECKIVTDAAKKQLVTPSHAYSAQTGRPGQAGARNSEAIYVGGAAYVQIKGIWRRSSMTVKDALELKDENIRDATAMDCRYLREETMNGDSAAVYSFDSSNEADHSVGQIWISKSRGLPLKIEQDLIADKSSKAHVSTRYEYTNVQAPAI